MKMSHEASCEKRRCVHGVGVRIPYIPNNIRCILYKYNRIYTLYVICYVFI